MKNISNLQAQMAKAMPYGQSVFVTRTRTYVTLLFLIFTSLNIWGMNYQECPRKNRKNLVWQINALKKTSRKLKQDKKTRNEVRDKFLLITKGFFFKEAIAIISLKQNTIISKDEMIGLYCDYIASRSFAKKENSNQNEFFKHVYSVDKYGLKKNITYLKNELIKIGVPKTSLE